MLRRHHYETAFEEYLRSRRTPYIAVDEARKALLPAGAELKAAPRNGVTPPVAPGGPFEALKSFDFVLYGSRVNLLVDVKGRKVARRSRPTTGAALAAVPRSGLESWVTQDDIESLLKWRTLFGPGFDAAFVFVYWCDDQPPDGLFQDVWEHRARWYAVRTVRLDDYTKAMRRRSPKWRTVHVPARDFESISTPGTGLDR
ncbi:MAG: HYExAFE family protein [Planctomycetes bacterium]|nr:HYExAFE family protein [Planctomycetota bacterium]